MACRNYAFIYEQASQRAIVPTENNTDLLMNDAHHSDVAHLQRCVVARTVWQ